ncbi:zinc finger RNA-binding protein isoform X4 [Bemisia tabaci]|uniref:zinc finger RNA-binding protein isoform X4 n=1 Tax=Bemisia tabaci TaxID=7038 RepID=UPI003B28AEBF
MTTNNYFGFTHGTQYSATPGTTYPTQQTGYSVTPGATAAAYPTQRTATGYETYQTQATPTAYAVPAGATTATTYDYGYARTAHSSPTAYDAKAYYQQQATPATPVTPAYSTSDYQTAGAAIVKPQYSATYSTQTTPQRQVVPPKPAVSAVQYSQYAPPQQQQQTPAQAVSSYTASYSTPASIQPTSQLNKAIGSAPRAITQRAPQQAVQQQTTGYQYTQRHPFKPQQQQQQQPPPQQVSQVQQLSQLQQQQQQQQHQQIKKPYQASPVSNVGSYQVNNPSTAQAAFVAQSTAAATNSNYNKPKPGYDTALFNAASHYINQQSGPNQNKPFYKKSFGNNASGLKNLRPKAPPKSQQLHYCEVCKISCAGPLTYREHLEGQKHKKKEAALKSDAPAPTISRGPISLHCDLCAVTCTGQDAYGAHIRGNKHQKVLKLHAMLGKPVPDIPEDPKIVVAKSIAAAKANQNTTAPDGKKTVVVPPKVNFVQSGSLSTTTKPEPKAEGKENTKSESTPEPKTEDIEMAAATLLENEVTPVGHEFVEEIKDELGKLVSFNCKLCECKFNDPNAKEMHMKGRRHRLAFKKKVNPNLQVDVKPSFNKKKHFEEKTRRTGGGGGPREEFMRGNQRNMHWQDRMMEVEERMYWDERRRFEEEMEFMEWGRRFHGPGMMPPPFPPGPGPRMMGPPFMPPPPPPQFPRRLDTSDDRHVIARHAAVYPNEQELKALQKIVSHTEKALKLVSDFLTENAQSTTDKKNGTSEVKTEVKVEPKTAESPAKPNATPNKKGPQKTKEDGRDGSLFSFEKETEERVLKGVMRVESLAKGLLLHGDTHVKLVVLCSEKPTRALLVKVAANLPSQLSIVAPEDSYLTNMKSEEAAITVQTKTEPKLTVSVILTSPLLREQVNAAGSDAPAAQSTPDPPDLLNKKKCLDALAALRHAKWFQARVAGMQNCLMIIRIFRDLCQRVPTWAPFSPWAMELLCEKALSSAGMPLSPGDSLRRVLEAVSSGVILQNGPGILDPCEKEPVDAAANLTPQQREDITASAQHALRLLAFRQIHKVLGMEPLPAPPPMPTNKFNNRGGYNRFGRKRRRDNSSGENTDSDAGVNEKKDKKDTDVVIKVEGAKVSTPAAATTPAKPAEAAKAPAATPAAAKGSLKSPAAAKPAVKK